MQLMAVAVPSIEQLKKEGEAGRRKITQYTRYGTVALALFQGLGIAIALESQAGLVLDPGPMFRFVTVLTLLTGTMFLMWVGEQITERGLGNGISIIIFAGIVAGLPRAAQDSGELRQTSGRQQDLWRSEFAFAFEIEYVWRNPADLCLVDNSLSRHRRRVVRLWRGHDVVEGYRRDPVSGAAYLCHPLRSCNHLLLFLLHGPGVQFQGDRR
jgi:hypothetical protein